jgi:hypothetical protein
MSSLQRLSDRLTNLRETAETLDQNLRLSLAMLIGRGLNQKGWTQKQLAAETGMREAQISRMVNTGQNWTSLSAARVLFALGIEADLVDTREMTVASITTDIGEQYGKAIQSALAAGGPGKSADTRRTIGFYAERAAATHANIIRGHPEGVERLAAVAVG